MKSFTGLASLTIALSIALSATAWAQDAPRATKDQPPDQNQPGAQDPTRLQDQTRTSAASQAGTIRGVIVDVVTVGEQMINPKTNQPMAAQGNFLKVMGSFSHNSRNNGGVNRDERNVPGSDNAIRPATPRTTGASDDQASTTTSGLNRQPGANLMGSQSRPSIFLVSMTQQTRLHQIRGNTRPSLNFRDSTSRDAAPSDATTPQPPTANDSTTNTSRTGSSTTQDSTAPPNSTQASFNQLELGDLVEIQITSQPASLTSGASQKHGRGRIYQAVASSINILPSGSMGMSRPGFDRQSDIAPERPTDVDSEKDRNRDRIPRTGNDPDRDRPGANSTPKDQ